MPRKKGTPNKRSQLLLWKLENEHKFFVVKELIELYGFDKQILVSLATRISENIENDLPPNTGFTEEEAEMYNNSNKSATAILIKLLGYLYPRLKATEVSSGSGEKIIFNINTGETDIKADKPNKPAKVVPLKGGSN
jgi:hypothetical protein